MPVHDSAADQPLPPPGGPLLMIDLLSAVYWFDEALQAGLKAHGWSAVTRVQSLVLANVASGVHRAVQLARNLGVSRQAMSQTLSEMEARGLVTVTPDPGDKRALVVNFSPQSGPIRDDAVRILRLIEAALGNRIGPRRLEALRDAAAVDWGPSPIDVVNAAAGVIPPTPKPRGRPRTKAAG